MLKIVRTNAKNRDFVELVEHLDTDLALRDGADHTYYSQFNKIDHIQYALVAYINQVAVGCGAIKAHGPDRAEIKRMYTHPQFRGNGIGSNLLSELEKWASELAYDKCILETGIRQPEAIGLYEKNGYKMTPNYGQYKGVENSVCFEKTLKRDKQ